MDVVPVPVFYPDVTRILDRPVLRRVADVPAPPALDVVNVFRRPADVMQHVDDILAARPKVVWLQVGVSSPEAEQAFAQAGIKVVANKCLMVEHRQALAEARDGGREGGGGGESRSML